MTNGDKIRNMSDEELVKLIMRDWICLYCSHSQDGCKFICNKGIKQWLESEETTNAKI